MIDEDVDKLYLILLIQLYKVKLQAQKFKVYNLLDDNLSR